MYTTNSVNRTKRKWVLLVIFLNGEKEQVGGVLYVTSVIKCIPLFTVGL